MPQDATTGSAANTWGRETARKIALKIGAKIPSTRTNEAIWQGKRVVNRTGFLRGHIP